MILKKIKQKKADPLESAVSFGYYKKSFIPIPAPVQAFQKQPVR